MTRFDQRLIRIIVRPSIVGQFHHPTGPGGHIAAWVMGHRSSNVQRNRWAVDLLDVQPADRVLELGCGPGVALAALAGRATRGLVVGVDHSEVMIRKARRRNAAAIRQGRVRLIHSPVERLQVTDGRFDAALAVNNVGMWPEPTTQLRDVGRLLRPGGRIALVSQPRCPGASAAMSAEAADMLRALLSQAGFREPRTEMLELNPPVCASSPLGHVASELAAVAVDDRLRPGASVDQIEAPVERSACDTASGAVAGNSAPIRRSGASQVLAEGSSNDFACGHAFLGGSFVDCLSQLRLEAHRQRLCRLGSHRGAAGPPTEP